MERYNEYTYSDIRQSVDPASRRRSKLLSTKYLGINKQGTIEFETTSGTTPGLFWKQKVKLRDFRVSIALPDPELKLIDRVRLAIAGDLAVTCNCTAFKYWGWAYIMTGLGSKFGQQENRFPKRRNPSLKGTVCKHLDNVLLVLPFQTGTIVSDLKKMGY